MHFHNKYINISPRTSFKSCTLLAQDIAIIFNVGLIRTTTNNHLQEYHKNIHFPAIITSRLNRFDPPHPSPVERLRR